MSLMITMILPRFPKLLLFSGQAWESTCYKHSVSNDLAFLNAFAGEICLKGGRRSQTFPTIPQIRAKFSMIILY